MNLSAEVTEKLSPGMARLASMLSGAERTKLSAGMAAEVRTEIVTHLFKLGQTRHKTANRLGASPTKFITRLAENFDQSSTVKVDDEGVSITMRHPVISRAFRDITIVPTGGKKFLTIPINAMAYGRRAGEIEGMFAHKNTLFLKQGDSLIAMYALVRSVTQPQDRSLLPSTDELLTAAARGATKEIKAVLQENGRLS